MRKNKSLTAITVIVLISLVGVIIAGIRIWKAAQRSFADDGYFLRAVEDEEGVSQQQLYFAMNTAYRTNYEDLIVFQDVDGSQNSVGIDSFIHYSDESLSSVMDGAVMDMDQINGGLINIYTLGDGLVLGREGERYAIDNNGNTLEFTNLLWKLNDETMLAYSPESTLHKGNGEETELEGCVEIRYLETGIVQVMTEGQVHQFLAADAYLKLQNGVIIRFDTQEIVDENGNVRMSLGEIFAGDQDNIKISSSVDWVPPTFKVTTIDGEDGESGEEGENGEEGEAGQAGDSGDTGSSGDSGNNGDTGEAGGAGKTGGSKNNGQGNSGGSTVTMSTMKVNGDDYVLTSGSISGSIAVEANEWELGEGSIKLIDAATGAVVSSVDHVNFGSGELSYPFDFQNLTPNTQYRLVVSAAYNYDIVDEQGNTTEMSGVKAFIDRTIYTDGSGVFIYEGEMTPTEIGITIDKKDYSDTRTVFLEVYDKDGNKLTLAPIAIDTTLYTQWPQDFKLTEWEPSLSQYLVPDGSYTVKAYTSSTTLEADKVDSAVFPVTTLKRTPNIEDAFVNTNTGYFVLGINTVSDPDAAISGYRYDIYDRGGTKVTSVSSATKENVRLYVDGETIKYGEYYYMEAVALYYDNAVSRELVINCDNPESFIMRATEDAMIYFEGAEKNGYDGVLFNRLYGYLRINATNREIYCNDREPITVTIQSTTGEYVGSTVVTAFAGQAEDTDSVLLDLPGLKADTRYVMRVAGTYLETVDPINAQKTTGMIGECIVKTPAAEPVEMQIEEDTDIQNYGDGVGIQAILKIPDDPEGAPAEIASARRLVMSLYLGNNSEGGTLVKQVELEVGKLDDAQIYDSSFMGQYYGSDKYYLINNKTFGINEADLQSVYTVKVEYLCDYTADEAYMKGSHNLTRYRNEIPCYVDEGNGEMGSVEVTIRKADNPPEFPNGMTAIGIKNEEAAAYGGVYDSSLADDTIVGYYLETPYDNSNAFARSVTYYTFKTVTMEAFEYRRVNNTAPAADPTQWTEQGAIVSRVTLPVQDANTKLPSLTVFFCEPPSDLEAVDISSGSGEDTPFRDLQDSEKAMTGVKMEEEKLYYKTGAVNNNYILYTSDPANIGRGWDYTFEYNVRLEYAGDYSYLYPNRMGGYQAANALDTTDPTYLRFISESLSVPKQKAQFISYLHDAASGKNTWYVHVDDPDEVMQKRGDSYALDVLDESGGKIAKTVDDNGFVDGTHEYYREIMVNMGSTTESDRYYALNASMLLFDDANIRYGTFEVNPAVANSTKVTRQDAYGVIVSHKNDPGLWDSDTDNWNSYVKDLKVDITYPGQGNVVTFTLGNIQADNLSYVPNRIARAQVAVTFKHEDGTEGEEKQIFDISFTRTDGAYTNLFDLTRVKGLQAGDQVYFQFSFLLDTGIAGFLGSDQAFDAESDLQELYAIQKLSDGTYMRVSPTDSEGNYSSAFYSTASSGYFSVNGTKLTEIAPHYMTQVGADSADQVLTGIGQMLKKNMIYNGSNVLVEPELYFRFGARGASTVTSFDSEITDSSSELTLKKLKMLDLEKSGATHVGTLMPSVYSVSFKPALYSTEMNFSTGSYNYMYPDGEGKRYMTLELYEYSGPKYPTDEQLKDPANYTLKGEQPVEILETQEGYNYNFIKLERGTHYKVEVKGEYYNGNGQKESGYIQKVDTANSNAMTDAIFYFQTSETVNLTEMTSEYQNTSYQTKDLGISYKADQTEGYTIEYSIWETDESGTKQYGEKELVDNDTIWKAMGYTWDETVKAWGKKGSTGEWKPHIYGSTTRETINASPGILGSAAQELAAALPPGHYYTLYAKVVDSAGNCLNTPAEGSNTADGFEYGTTFRIPTVAAPISYIWNVVNDSYNRIQLQYKVVDSSRVIVDDEYTAVLYWKDDQGEWQPFETLSKHQSNTGSAMVTEMQTWDITKLVNSEVGDYKLELKAKLDYAFSGKGEDVTLKSLEFHTDSLQGDQIGTVTAQPEQVGTAKSVRLYLSEWSAPDNILEVTYTIMPKDELTYVGQGSEIKSGNTALFENDSLLLKSIQVPSDQSGMYILTWQIWGTRGAGTTKMMLDDGTQLIKM